MRAGMVHLVFGVVLVVAGYLADTYIKGFFWVGAYIVGALEIVRGVIIMIRMRKLLE